jgi:DNA-binding transcriptional LysR family regulator
MIAVRVSDEIRSVVVAAPAYLKRRGMPKTPQELSAHDCIRLRLPSGALTRELAEPAFEKCFRTLR